MGEGYPHIIVDDPLCPQFVHASGDLNFLPTEEQGKRFKVVDPVMRTLDWLGEEVQILPDWVEKLGCIPSYRDMSDKPKKFTKPSTQEIAKRRAKNKEARKSRKRNR